MTPLFLLTSVALADDPELVPEVQIRPRWIADSGRDGEPAEGTVSFFTMRSRLGATLHLEDLAVRVVVGDVRVFGEELDTRRDFSADGLDVPIATATWSPGDVTLLAGRMQEPLQEQRLLAISAWRQPGRSFDGVLFRFFRDAWRVEARGLMIREGDLLELPVTDQAFPADGDVTLTTLTAGRRTEHVTAEGTLLYRHNAVLPSDLVTGGAFVDAHLGSWALRFEAYGQLGEREDQTVRAGLASAMVSWVAPFGPSPVTTLQYDVLSGDGDPDDDVLTAFDTLYGANHRYYGHIDMATFFVGGFGDRQGLHDISLRGAISPSERLDLALDLHAFFAAAPLDDPFLAVEPDFEARLAVGSGLDLLGGVNLWFPPDDTAEWMTWAMLDARL